MSPFRKNVQSYRVLKSWVARCLLKAFVRPKLKINQKIKKWNEKAVQTDYFVFFFFDIDLNQVLVRLMIMWLKLRMSIN